MFASYDTIYGSNQLNAKSTEPVEMVMLSLCPNVDDGWNSDDTV